jgi:putative ubiquitin-RnfH superfamily antitoxin RatB of RatAB toxin-antitoxin module
MRVEVVYALPGGHDATTVELPAGATAADALAASGMAGRHPGHDLSQLGIFGRRVAGDARVAEGDRLEIYRPLALDPKESRRRRARGAAGKRKSRP